MKEFLLALVLLALVGCNHALGAAGTALDAASVAGDIYYEEVLERHAMELDRIYALPEEQRSVELEALHAYFEPFIVAHELFIEAWTLAAKSWMAAREGRTDIEAVIQAVLRVSEIVTGLVAP